MSTTRTHHDCFWCELDRRRKARMEATLPEPVCPCCGTIGHREIECPQIVHRARDRSGRLDDCCREDLPELGPQRTKFLAGQEDDLARLCREDGGETA